MSYEPGSEPEAPLPPHNGAVNQAIQEPRHPANGVVPVPATNGSNVVVPEGRKPATGVQADGAKMANEDKPAVSGEAHDEPVKPRPAWLKPVILGGLVIILLFCVPWILRYWHYSHTHVSTDDAYVTGNLTNVSPITSGTLLQLTVDEGSYVKRGQLVARQDPAGPRASLRQALAAYNAALTQIPQAERNLAFQDQSTRATIRHAQASLAVQDAKTQGAARQVILTAGTTNNQVREARAKIEQANAQVEQNLALVQSALANAANSQQGVQTSQASLQSVQQQIQTAQKAYQAAQARIELAHAELDRNTKDEERYHTLYLQDATSEQTYDNAHALTRSAAATLSANLAMAEEARSQVDQAKSNAAAAQSQVDQSYQAVKQSQAQVVAAQRAADAAGKQVSVEEAAYAVAKSNGLQVGVQQAALASNTRQAGESQADVATALAGKEQVAVRLKQIDTYRAQAAESRAAVTNAQITLDDTNIFAPTDGIVVHKAANIGASILAGQTIVTVTQGEYVWVEANYKETQLADVVAGEPAELEVDALPGKIFKGHVRSVNEASGAATSLLPPDNATGNFTKVVQRIPVRIEFDSASDGADPKYGRLKDLINLRQGMSVVANIDVSDADKYRRKLDGQRAGGVHAGRGDIPTAPVSPQAKPKGSPPISEPTHAPRPLQRVTKQLPRLCCTTKPKATRVYVRNRAATLEVRLRRPLCIVQLQSRLCCASPSVWRVALC